MGYVQEMWESFAEQALPAGISQNQRTILQQAFYAGVSSMMAIQLGHAGDDVTEDEAVQAIMDCADELRQFVDAIRTPKTH